MDLIETKFTLNNRHPWELARQNIVLNLIKKHYDKSIEILDIGSGDAYLADYLTKNITKSRAYSIDIEYTDEIINMLNNIYNNSNLHLYSSLEDIKVDKIDVVTLLDVIEHVPNDIDFLSNLIKRPYFNENTLFIFTAPAYQSLFSRHDEALKHYRRYNLKQFKKVIQKSNLKYIEGGFFFFSLIFPRLIQLVSEKIFQKEKVELNKVGNWNKGKILTSILKGTLLLDYRIGRILNFLKIKLPGLSCYAICSINKDSVK